jgi:hypothetical protein
MSGATCSIKSQFSLELVGILITRGTVFSSFSVQLGFPWLPHSQYSVSLVWSPPAPCWVCP